MVVIVVVVVVAVAVAVGLGVVVWAVIGRHVIKSCDWVSKRGGGIRQGTSGRYPEIQHAACDALLT